MGRARSARSAHQGPQSPGGSVDHGALRARDVSAAPHVAEPGNRQASARLRPLPLPQPFRGACRQLSDPAASQLAPRVEEAIDRELRAVSPRQAPSGRRPVAAYWRRGRASRPTCSPTPRRGARRSRGVWNQGSPLDSAFACLTHAEPTSQRLLGKASHPSCDSHLAAEPSRVSVPCSCGSHLDASLHRRVYQRLSRDLLGESRRR